MDSFYITRTDMRRIICIMCAFTVVCSLCTTIILSFTCSKQSEPHDKIESSDLRTEDETLPFRRPLYIAAVYTDGSIAVFSGGDGHILRILDVTAANLPCTDLMLLSSGIPLYSDEELCSLIADYTG